MPAIAIIFAGIARSYDFSSTSLNIRSTPDSHSGRYKPNARCSFVVSMRELNGRLAGVGKALVGTALVASAETLMSIPARRAKSMTKLA